jgi:tripartite-type tricarboxylate transporter receptor subunit TctC
MRVAKTLAGSLLALSVLALSALPSAAQNWPTHPVKVLLPLGPGSGADIGARLIAEKLAAKWSQPVVVENRPGGDGFVAINAFVSAHDDHMLFFAPAASFTAHPYLHEKLPYDPRDLAPVARVSATVVSLTAPPQLNIKSLGELMAMARAAGQAELGVRHRRHRSGDRGLPQARGPRHGQDSLSRSGPGAQRRGRGPPTILLVIAGNRPGRD